MTAQRLLEPAIKTVRPVMGRMRATVWTVWHMRILAQRGVATVARTGLRTQQGLDARNTSARAIRSATAVLALAPVTASSASTTLISKSSGMKKSADVMTGGVGIAVQFGRDHATTNVITVTVRLGATAISVPTMRTLITMGTACAKRTGMDRNVRAMLGRVMATVSRLALCCLAAGRPIETVCSVPTMHTATKTGSVPVARIGAGLTARCTPASVIQSATAVMDQQTQTVKSA
jgi:hypothetical protein